MDCFPAAVELVRAFMPASHLNDSDVVVVKVELFAGVEWFQALDSRHSETFDAENLKA